ncbi:2292_t:CDS:2, partial [Gigaspora margarita]
GSKGPRNSSDICPNVLYLPLSALYTASFARQIGQLRIPLRTDLTRQRTQNTCEQQRRIGFQAISIEIINVDMFQKS